MFNCKDKELRKFLKEMGFFHNEDPCNHMISSAKLDRVMQVKGFEKVSDNDELSQLRKSNKELKQRLDAIMELLGITYEEAHEEPAKLKKGAKSVDIKTDKDAADAVSIRLKSFGLY